MENIFSELRKSLLIYYNSQIILSSVFSNKNDCIKTIPSKKYKKAGVLCLLDNNKNCLNVILTLRSKKLTTHPGQISFPGGKVNNNEDFYECALRETEEEIGLTREKVKVVGELNLYLTGSKFLIKPIIGYAEEKYKISLNKEEVDELIYFPINYILKDTNIFKKYYLDKTKKKKFFYYDINWKNYRIWGTTAIILVHLSKIISKIL